MFAICGGTVVNEAWSGAATVLVEDGVIDSIHDPSVRMPDSVERVVRADGMLVLPGGVDPHCHVQNTIGEFSTLDNYAEATEAALRGGTTTIVDFAIPTPDESPLSAVQSRLEQVRSAQADVGLHGCVVDWSDDMPHQLRAMADLGVRTIKMFTTYRDTLMVSADTIVAVMNELVELEGIAYIHAESNHLIEAVHSERLKLHKMDASHHASTRPQYTELAAVNEVLSIAEALNTHVYLVHQSTDEAVRAITRARERGVRAYSETCPHYLLLTDQYYSGPEPERYVCCPPLRDPDTVNRLRQQAFTHDIHTIGSDHNCFSLEQKFRAPGDVRNMPNGLPGVETRLPVLFSELVSRRGLPCEEFVRLVSANPARLNGMYPRKGAIAPGADADMVILNPNETRLITTDELHMRTDYDPYEGYEITGWPHTVISGGEVVLDETGFHSRKREGRFIASNPISSQLVC